MTIFTPDDSEVTEVVLPDGTNASEVVAPDGTVVFSPGPDIPDSVVAQYDATALSLSDGDTVNTWTDEEGSTDLSAVGAPTYQSSGINGSPVVSYDGTDDGHQNSDFTLSQRNAIFAVAKQTNDQNHRIVTGTASERQILSLNDSGNKGIWASSWVYGSASDTSAHILGGIYDGSNSELRVDGTVEASGDPGANTFNGVSVGTNYGADNNFLDGVVGEVLLVDNPSSGDIDEIESYLSNKWGITL